MKAEWFIGPAISVALFGLFVLYINKKYAPTIAAVNTTNTALGVVEHPIDAIEKAWNSIFPGNNGNGTSATPSMASTS